MDNNQDDREGIDHDEDDTPTCAWCDLPEGATTDTFEGTEHAGGVGVHVLGALVPCGDHLAHDGECKYACQSEHEAD